MRPGTPLVNCATPSEPQRYLSAIPLGLSAPDSHFASVLGLTQIRRAKMGWLMFRLSRSSFIVRAEISVEGSMQS